MQQLNTVAIIYGYNIEQIFREFSSVELILLFELF